MDRDDRAYSDLMANAGFSTERIAHESAADGRI